MSDDLRLYCTLRNNRVLNFKCVVYANREHLLELIVQFRKVNVFKYLYNIVHFMERLINQVFGWESIVSFDLDVQALVFGDQIILYANIFKNSCALFMTLQIVF